MDDLQYILCVVGLKLVAPLIIIYGMFLILEKTNG